MSFDKCTYLLDSDVIIWVLRKQERTLKLVDEISRSGVPACSPLSVIEIMIGAKPGEEEATTGLLTALQLLPVDRAIAERAAEYIRVYQNKDNPDFADAIIAATAVTHNLILVTYNRKHYPMPEIKLYPVEKHP